MKTYKRYLLPIFLALSPSLILWSAEPLIKTSYVTARGGESLRDLLEYQVGIPESVLVQDGYLDKIKQWNPSIDDTSSLIPGEQVYVEIPYRVALTPQLKPSTIEGLSANDFKESAQRETANVGGESAPIVAVIQNNDENQSTGKWNFSIFYALSRGTFQESIVNSNISTQSSQDSPITLGLATSKRINYDWSYSGSLYASKLNGSVSDQNEKISIPWEYGLNSYLGYRKRELAIRSLYWS